LILFSLVFDLAYILSASCLISLIKWSLHPCSMRFMLFQACKWPSKLCCCV
jgi:hypothetical protein